MSPQTAPPKGSLFTLVAFVRNPLTIKVIFAMINIHHFLHFDASSFATSVRPTIKIDSLIKNTFPCSYCSRFKVMEKIMNICVLFQYKNLRNRYQYFFRYQFFSKPIPILFSIPKKFKTDTDTIKTIGKVSKPRSFETEMSHSVAQLRGWYSSCRRQKE